jgi:hypothetical protein
LEEVPVDGLGRMVRIGSQLDADLKVLLVAFLRDNTEFFTWSHKYMTGIDPSVMVLKLNVDLDYRLVKQNRRSYSSKRNRAIMEEVEKLLQSGFIREVYYPDLLASVVMVKKSNGKWRMCVDFTNLNKVYPKDSFPLPRIDLLVDST